MKKVCTTVRPHFYTLYALNFCTKTLNINLNIKDQKELSMEKYRAGDHLSVTRIGYWHHGIYIGDGEVIHFNGAPDAAGDLGLAIIQTDSLEFFSGDTIPEVVPYKEPRYSAHEVVKRAHLRLGERGYSFITNNCEHFAHWCKTGVHSSEQSKNYIAAALAGSLLLGPFGPLALGGCIDLTDRLTYQYKCRCGLAVQRFIQFLVHRHLVVWVLNFGVRHGCGYGHRILFDRGTVYPCAKL